MTSILGCIIGLLVAAFGLYYFIKEKSSPESRRIYGAAVCVGIAVLAVSAVMLAL